METLPDYYQFPTDSRKRIICWGTSLDVLTIQHLKIILEKEKKEENSFIVLIYMPCYCS